MQRLLANVKGEESQIFLYLSVMLRHRDRDSNGLLDSIFKGMKVFGLSFWISTDLYFSNADIDSAFELAERLQYMDLLSPAADPSGIDP